MNRTAGVSHRSIWLFLLALCCPLGHAAQDSDADTDVLLKALKAQATDKQDKAAIRTIAYLEERFAEEVASQKKIAQALASCLKRPREVEQPALHVAVLEAFEDMGTIGKKNLIRALKHKNVTGSPKVLAAGLLSLGSFADPGQVKTLSGFLVKRDPIVIKAAAEALGHYRYHSQKVRKPIVGTLVRSYSGTATQRTGALAYTDTGSSMLILDVRKSFQQALTRLTDVKLDTAALWRDWWNQNKKAAWREFKRDED